MEQENTTPSDQCSCIHLDGVSAGGVNPPVDCSLQGCGICSRLTKLDDEILKAHKILVDLSHQRIVLKSQLDYHHKPLINRLPFELVSRIFIDVIKEFPEDTEWDISIPPVLAAVCKMWRDVALGTPQLWTKVDLIIDSRRSLYKFDLAKEWFTRSRSLPLSILIYFPWELDCPKNCGPSAELASQFHPMIDLVRSHSARWSRIAIEISNPNLLHRLLNNIENIPADLEHMLVGWCRSASKSFNTEPFLLPRTITQEYSRLDHIGLWDLPCGFERLTRIEMVGVPIDEVLYFIQIAPNLQECSASFDEDVQDNMFPIPTTPIVAERLALLHTNFTSQSEFFNCLTLPSLQTLTHDYDCISSRDQFDDLVACLERSSPPLQSFHLGLAISSPRVDDWYENLPTVTYIEVDLSNNMLPPNYLKSNQCSITEEFLAALARRSGPLVFPKLRILDLSTRGMSKASWSSLCNIFQNNTEQNAEGSQAQTVGDEVPPINRDLLKEIRIFVTAKWKRDFVVEARVFRKFKALEEDGVKLKVYHPRGPEFGKSALAV